jgi:hypothetical protein
MVAPPPLLARFHQLLIGAAIALALLFAAYNFSRGGPALGLVSLGVALGLALYLRWFMRKGLGKPSL